MFLDKSGRIFVDVHDARYPAMQDFLVTCADPVSRTSNVNEYRLTSSSLACATADGVYTMARVRAALLDFCSNLGGGQLPLPVEAMIAQEERADRLRLVLTKRIHSASDDLAEGEASLLGYFLVSDSREHLTAVVPLIKEWLEPVNVRGVWLQVFSERSPTGGVVYKSALRPNSLRAVREVLLKQSRMTVDLYYDYKADTSGLSVKNFSLKDGVKLRPYQSLSLERFQRNGVAHHGIVVLPCGAGKTLTGIAAAQLVQKRVAIMCINHQSALQWRRELLQYTTLDPAQVTMCLADSKQLPGDVFITTYSMLTVSRREQLLQDGSVSENAKMTDAILEAVANASWGLLILDEVHQATAEQFQKCVDKVPHHCVLGLSATLLREDDRIEDLRYLVGPKLYEANWLELARAGFLASVTCAEVRCPTPPSFLRAYLAPPKGGGGTAGRLLPLECLNPHKLFATQALLQFHQTKNPPDKTIIFCDSVACGRYYARKLAIPFMDGATKERERGNLLQWFRSTREVNAIVLSRVGDVALDLPEASVIIQISGLGASRRQEAQRLGRILRAKPPTVDSSTGYFYSLVAEDTDEVPRAAWRQEWLREQGFAYRILPLSLVLTSANRSREEARSHFRTETTQLARSLLHPMCAAPARWSYLVETSGEFVELPPTPFMHQAEASFFRGHDSSFPHQPTDKTPHIIFSGAIGAGGENGSIGTFRPTGQSNYYPLFMRPAPSHCCGEECEMELIRVGTSQRDHKKRRLETTGSLQNKAL